jgi:hypothetical protein
VGTLPTAWVALATQLADLSNRLQHADLVVRRHDCDQDGLIVDGAFQVVEIDQAILLDGHIGDAVAIFLQTLASVEHSLMLSHGGDDVIALLPVHLGDALDSEVIALRSARSEYDFFCGRAYQLGNALTRCLDALFGGPAKGMITAGGVAEFLHEVGEHLFQHPRIHGGRGVVIHVDGELDALGIGVLRLRLGLGDFYVRAH